MDTKPGSINVFNPNQNIIEHLIMLIESQGFESKYGTLEHFESWQRLKAMAVSSYNQLLRFHERNVNPPLVLEPKGGFEESRLRMELKRTQADAAAWAFAAVVQVIVIVAAVVMGVLR